LLVFFGLLVINRLLLTWHQRRLFARGEGMRRVVVIGQGRVADNFVALLDERPWLGLRCAGTVPARGTLSVERIQQLARADGPCEIVVALDPEDASGFDRVTMALTQAGMAFRVVPALFEASLHAARVYGFREPPVFDVLVDPMDQVRCSFKRAFDVLVSTLALLAVAPVLLVVAAAVWFDSPGPVIFRQVRLGMGGRPFEILKFRTMVVDAERRLEELKAQDEGDGPHFKMKHDPRITRIGAVLRKWSLDELLQFVNVVRGDMSLVGPRPPLPREVDKYATEALIRLKGKPGITGLWQVSGRKDLAFEDMVRLDRHYLENWSIGMDLGIMMRTVGVVFARRGAY
jgi:exopolysaccharide biosynthesis polyprenyl glycosylphosphotransferase